MKRPTRRPRSGMSRAALWVLLLAPSALAFPGLLEAQGGPAGSIHGTVLDPSGYAVANAAVQAAPAVGTALTANTNATGAYQLNNLPAGTYTIQVSVMGFAPYKKENVVVAAGRALQLDINLAIQQQKEQVTVAGDALTVDTSPSNNASAVVLTGQELDALPDDPDELQQDLDALAGPSAGPNGGQMYIDGFTAGQLPPKSSIREIRINQNPFSAEFDKVGYGRIEIFTKPGTNQWHGQSSLNATDVLFNARNPFITTSSAPPYHSLQANENVGGPLNSKSSIFFNLDYRDIDDQSVVSAATLSSTGTEEPFATTVANLRTRLNVGPRLDYQLTKNNTLSIRYQYYRDNEMNDGIGGASLPSQAYNTLTTENTLQLTDTQLIGANIVNEFRFQYLGQGNTQAPQNTLDATVTIPGTLVQGGYNAGINVDWQNHYEVQNYTSYSFGKHFLKFGVRLRDVTDTNSTTGGFIGSFTFACVVSCANSLATGTPAQFTLTTGLPGAHVNMLDAGPYIEDDWRVRPSITLSYGLRFESQTGIHDFADWAPRVGVAWGVGGGGKASPKVVLRGGFGVFYDRFTAPDILQAARENGIIQTGLTLDNPGAGTYCVTLSACPSLPAMEADALRTIYQIAPNLHAPYILQSAASAERAITKKITVSVSYLNSQGHDQLITNNVNSPVLNGVATSPANGGLYPVAPNEVIMQYQSVGIYRQSQLVVNTTVRAGTRLMLNGYYSLNYANGDVVSSPSNPYNLMADYGREAFGIRDRGFFGGTIAAPWGLRVSPFLVANSGTPYNITLAEDLIGSTLLNQRPGFISNQTCAVRQISSSQGKTNNVYCTPFGTFDAQPSPGEPIVPIDYLTGPGRFSLNLRVAKTFSFGGKAGEGRVGRQGGGGGGGQRGGGFGGRPGFGGPLGGNGGINGNAGRFNFTASINARNVFNNVNFGTPIGNLTSPLFGQSNSLAAGGGPGAGGVGGAGGNAANRAVYLEGIFAF